MLNAAFQQRDTLQQRIFSNGLPFSRGYTSENLHRMAKLGVNYHFPLLYPDAGFANIVYILRVRANLFYDHTYLRDFYRDKRPFKASLRSVGTEIFFDTAGGTSYCQLSACATATCLTGIYLAAAAGSGLRWYCRLICWRGKTPCCFVLKQDSQD